MDPRLQQPSMPSPRNLPINGLSPPVTPALSSHQPAPAPIPPQPAPVAATPQNVSMPAPAAVVVPPPSYEVVGHIQLAQPGAATVPTPPFPAAKNETQQGDDDLDKILQAVNNRVQAPSVPEAKKGSQILSKLSDKTAKVPKLKSGAASQRPIGVFVVVIIVFLILSAVAVKAYHQSSGKPVVSNQPSQVGTSYRSAAAIQTAGGSLVRPADLDSYSQDLSGKLNSLNDSQDFSPDALNSSVLGL